MRNNEVMIPIRIAVIVPQLLYRKQYAIKIKPNYFYFIFFFFAKGRATITLMAGFMYLIISTT